MFHRLFAFGLISAMMVCGCVNVNPGADQDGDDDGDVNGDDVTAVEVFITESFVAADRMGTTTATVEEAICDGWFPAAPNHELLIDNALAMTVRASGGDDLRLLIKVGESRFCGQGATSQEVSRFWGTGIAEVFIGFVDEP
jgi:hypothetical protein